MSTALDVDSLQSMLDRVPLSRLLPLRVATVEPDRGELELRFLPQSSHGRSDGAAQIHGGVLAALIDVAAACVVGVAARVEAATVDLRVDYLRPARGELVVAARCVRIGRRIATADVVVSTVEVEDVAVGRATLLPLGEGGGRR